jgi:toluene monooxygenase system ferredoxin subunit
MAFVKVCGLGDLGSDGMGGFYVEGSEILVLRDAQGAIRAFDGICPHQDSLLADGHFDGATIVCPTHGWMFNAVTGKGINPSSCRIAPYPVKLEGDEVYVDPDTELVVED